LNRGKYNMQDSELVAAARAGNRRRVKELWPQPNRDHERAAVTAAAKGGHSGVLRWMARAGAVFEDSALFSLAKAGKLKLLKYLRKHCSGLIGRAGQILALGGLEGGHLDVLVWLEAESIITAKSIWVQWYRVAGSLALLEWVRERDPERGAHFTHSADGASVIVRMGAAGIEWACRNTDFGDPKTRTSESVRIVLRDALTEEKSDVLAWLEKNSLAPGWPVHPQAPPITAEFGHDILRCSLIKNRFSAWEWLHSRGLITSRDIMGAGLITLALKHGRLGVLRWILEKCPDSFEGGRQHVYWLQCDGKLETLAWVERTFPSWEKSWRPWPLMRAGRKKAAWAERCYEHAYDRTPESVFVAANAHEAWLRVRQRRRMQAMLTLLAAHRKLKRRSLPPELWELVAERVTERRA